jgi:hypothetical protein
MLQVIGSILSKLRKSSSFVGSQTIKLGAGSVVLILGTCFFAGGLRFFDQDFDPSGY